MAEDVWYYEKDGQQYGPVSHAELQRLIESGYLSRHNLAWKPGEKDWSASGSFHDLAAAFKTPPPVKKPPPPRPPPVRPGEPPPQAEPQGDTAPRPPETKPAKPWYERFGAFVAWLWNSLKKINKEFGGKPAQKLRELFTHYPVRMWLAVLLGIGAPSGVIVYEVYEVTKSPPPKPAPIPTSLAGTRVPAGYTGPVGQIKIDAYPWAQVTRFADAEKGRELAVPGGQSTPLVLLVAPGSYRIELDGGKASCDVVVAQEQSRTCQRIVRSVDSASYYQEIGW